MSLQEFLIGPIKDGVRSDLKPFAIPDDAFESLVNAFQFRGRVRRRLGFTLLGRLQQVVANTTTGLTTSGGGAISGNLGTVFSLPTGFSIAPGTVIITIGADVFTDNGMGLLIASTTGSGTINYKTGAFAIIGAPATTAVFAAFSWYTNLPVMGVRKRDLSIINDQNLIAFDTKYAYLFTNSGFELLPSTMPVVWSGQNFQLFFTTNYASSFWATNNNPGLNGVLIATIVPGMSTSTVTTTVSHGFISGQTVVIINDAGTNNINGNSFIITVTGANTFTIPIVASGSGTGGIALNSQVTSTGFDGIRYYPGPSNTTWVNYNPPIDPNNALAGALLMFPYKGYFVFLNTWEGNNNSTLNNFPQRARWTQVGNPYYSVPVPAIYNGATNPNVMRSDLFNGAGQLDAPTSEQIVGAEFIRDILVVYFQYSTWRLRFQQSALQPFVWERVNIELGSQSTFSSVAFDKGLMAIGTRGIVISDANDTKRIDNKIPDQVFDFSQSNNGPYRIYGIRTFRTRLIYWSYPINGDYIVTFPNRLLVYNYDTANWATFIDSFTCFGNFLPSNPVTWNDLKQPWSSYTDVTAQSGAITEFYEQVVAGNQQGFVLTIESLDQITNEPSLSISNIGTGMTTGVFTSNNHNLEIGDWINLSGITGSTSDDGVSLNGRNYQIYTVSANTFTLSEFASVDAGSVTTPWTKFTYHLDEPFISIYPFSVQINIGTIVMTDPDGDGRLYDASNVFYGTINYTTGNLVLTFPTPFISDTEVYIRVVANQEISFVTTEGAYTGGGLITVIPNFSIQSKYFNFFPKAQKTRIHYMDIYTDQTANGEFTCDMYGDGNESIVINPPLPDNLRSNVVETTQNPYQISDANTTIYRIYTESQASTVQFDFNLSDQEMAVDAINSSSVDIQGIVVHARPSGRLI